MLGLNCLFTCCKTGKNRTINDYWARPERRQILDRLTRSQASLDDCKELIHHWRFVSKSNQRLTMLECSRLAFSNSSFRIPLIKAGIVSCVLNQVIEKDSSNKESALEPLIWIALEPECAEYIIKESGLEKLMAICRSKNEEVRINCMKCLRHLSSHARIQQAITPLMIRIMDCLDDSNESVRALTSEVIAKWIKSQNPMINKKIASALELIVNRLTDSVENIRWAAANAVLDLCSSNYQERLRDQYGVISQLISTLNQNEEVPINPAVIAAINRLFKSQHPSDRDMQSLSYSMTQLLDHDNDDIRTLTIEFWYDRRFHAGIDNDSLLLKYIVLINDHVEDIRKKALELLIVQSNKSEFKNIMYRLNGVGELENRYLVEKSPVIHDNVKSLLLKCNVNINRLDRKMKKIMVGK